MITAWELVTRRVVLTGTVAQEITLRSGTVYELRTSAPVLVAEGQSEPGEGDLRLIADTPLTFLCPESGSISVKNATGTDAAVWLRAEVKRVHTCNCGSKTCGC